MSQTNKAFIVLILLLLISSSVLVAQPGTGRLHGQVADPSAAVIPGATVTLKSSGGTAVTAQSDGEGNYDLKNVPAGTYTLTISEKGFRPFTQQVEIAAGQSKKLDAILEIAAKQEEIDVQGDAAKVSVNPEGNSSSVVISGKDLDALSDDPDELQSELQALAGPSAGPNGGQIYIDGFTGGQLPPKASIREIRINQNPFSAEYDRMGFGRIEILTKPGTDKLHGQIFYNDNHSIFDALNPFAATEPDFSTEILNANVGGPLNKKASYFLNFERRNINDAAVIAPTAFAAAGLPVVGLSNPRVRTNISSRLDYQLSGSNTLTARYQFTDNNEENNGVSQLSLPSLAFNQSSIEHTIQLSDTQVLSARAVNETRFEWQRDNAEQNSLNSAPEINVLGTFADGGNPLGNSSVITNHYELQNYTSLSLNTHFLRLGGRLRATAETNTSTQNFNGTFTFPTLQAFQSNTPSQLLIVRGNPTISETFVDAGVYAEDDWKFRPNMTLSYGLRFETQNGIHDHGDWAPRVGFAWGLGGKKNTAPKTVIRTGLGIFYDRFGQNLILQAERLNGLNQQQFVIANPTTFPNIPDLSTLTGIAPTIYSINPSLKAPYTIQAAASVERQVTRTSTLSVTYLHSHGVHQLFSSVLSTTPSPQYQFQSGGAFNQNQLIANFRILTSRRLRLTLFSYYSLSFANGNTSGAGSFPSDPVLGINADYGRTAYDVRNRVFLGGSIGLPKGFRLSPFIVAQSGTPFNIIVGDDLNGDSIFNDRPAFASSATAPQNLVATQFGNFDIAPGPGAPRIPINLGTSAAQATVNFRLSKTFGIGPKTEAANSSNQRQGEGGQRGNVPPGGGRGPGGNPGIGRGPGGPGGLGNLERTDQRYNLTLSLNVRNALNTVNPAPPVGNLSSPNFGRSLGLAGGPFNTQSANRRLDMQVMFSF